MIVVTLQKEWYAYERMFNRFHNLKSPLDIPSQTLLQAEVLVASGGSTAVNGLTKLQCKGNDLLMFYAIHNGPQTSCSS